MAGVRGRSGGANRLSFTEHQRRGTVQPVRVPHYRPDPPPAPALSDRLRRQALGGLSGEARKLAAQLLDTYPDGWDAAALQTLRLFAESSARLAALQEDPKELHREIRINLKLLQALDLDR